MNQHSLSLTILILVSLASMALWVYVGLSLSRLTRTMVALREGLSSTPVPLSAAVRESTEGFAGALLESEAKKRHGGEQRQPPEKYRYVTSLVAQGMGAAEIATALNLSRNEVEQLISLARLARRGSES